MINTNIMALIYDGISEYHVVEGDSISLPCNITKNEWTNGLISLIVWYRSKNQGIPIYSIDIRTQQQQQPLFENDNKKYNNNNNNTTRLYMDFDIDPPVLNLDSVQLNDNDDYRCRVDYRMNRTKQFLIHLNVLAIPKNVTIYDLLGNKIENGSLIHQPYNEGDKVVLYCDAFGGSPPPVVIWKYDDDNKIIDDTYEFINISTASTSNIDDNNNQMMMKTRNRLEILQIDRTFLLKEIICEAYPYLIYNNSNNNEKNSSKINQTIDNQFNSLSLSSFDKNNNKDKIIYHNHHHQQQQQQQQKHHHHHHHSFIQRTSIILDLNLRPLSVQIQVPNNFQPNLNRSTFSGTISSSSSSSSTSASMYMSVPSAFRLPSSSSSSSSLSSSLSTYNGNVLILSAGKKMEIECRTWGSRPPAEITWWRGSRRLPTSSSRLYFTNDLNNNNNNNSISNYNNDSLINVSMYQSMTSMNNEYLYKQLNLSISILTYISSPEDDGQRLTCRADNLQLEHEEIEDSVIISVRYAPLLTLSLGSKIPENIREGSDVYFECISKSNPPLTEVVWLFEGKPLINDPVQGILVTNQSLVMQRVNRDHRGNYQCAASNPEGISASNKVFLNVHFSPICKPTQTLIYGVARTEQIRVSCEVEAEPITPIQFRWYFNNSLENYELSKDEYTLEILQPNSSIEKSKKFFNNPHLLSQLSLENVFSTIVSMNNYVEPNVARSNATYSPRSRIGYGLLYCMAENSVGVQRDPCIFKIIEAGQPNSVHDCRIFNVTMTSFILKCIPGENGGLRQIFHLEVYNIEKEHLQTNVTRDNPVFEVDKLPPETAFILNVFSSNDKGRSDSVTLRTATRAYAEKHTTNGKKQKALLLDDINQLIINPIFGALIVALISLILLCLATIVFIRSRFCSKSHQSSSSSSNNSPDYNNQRDLKNDELNYLNENSTFDKHKNNEKLFVSFSNHSPTLPSTSLTTTTTTPMNHHNHPHHHHQQQQQQQQYLIRSSFTSEAPTFVEYHTHNSINDNTNNNIRNCTPMTDICSTILNKQTESNPYYVTTSTNNNNNDFIPLQHSMASSSRYSTATTTSTNSQSDLMTNAFTYNLAEAAPSVTTTNAIYPISNDLIKISSINCPFNNNHNNNNSNQTLSSRDLSSSILRPVTIENISSSLSNKTVDDEWPHLRSDINNTLIQSTTNNDNFQRQLTQLNIPP